jgi:hypothetical protein
MRQDNTTIADWVDSDFQVSRLRWRRGRVTVANVDVFVAVVGK